MSLESFILWSDEQKIEQQYKPKNHYELRSKKT
jgi:hypothetical protein